MATSQIDATAKNAERAFVLIKSRLGPLFALFSQEGVTEVNLNGVDNVWITRLGKREKVDVTGISEVSAAAAVRELASSMGQEAVESTPTAIVDAKMPGLRFSAILAPVASNGTILSIRQHNNTVRRLSDYIHDGVLPASVAEALSNHIKNGSNILIGGGTDSGKTTFLNALTREIPNTERVLTIEDTRELSVIVPNWVALETNASKQVTATLLVKATLRHSPDRIICGELRDGVAADFISSCNTGHHGCMATLHASSAMLTLERLEDLCLQGASDWPLAAIQRNIGRAIQLVVHLEKKDGQRRVTEVLQIDGFDLQSHSYNVTSIFNHQNQEP
jgi:pilus assembly protein CpaF